MSKDQAESPVSSLSRRSGLPRLTSNFPSVLHSRSHTSDSSTSGSFVSHPSPLSRFQPLALKRVFSSQANKERNQDQHRNIGCSPRSSKPSCSSWIPSFHSKNSSSAAWNVIPHEERERDYRESWRDESSIFSQQLAKITRGSNEDLWTSCRPCISVPRPAWPADGSHSYSSHRGITKECIGRKVIVGDKEEGILRYFGRTAFSSGYWCGVELEAPIGKNDGSVDGVIYFSCKSDHGIFAPDTKVSIIEYPEIEVSMKNSNYVGSSSSNNSNCGNSSSLYRLSAGSSSSSSSGLSGHSIDSKRSSGGSSATYTIVGRAKDSIPSTPNDSKSLFKDYSLCEEVSSDPISPETGTCDDSSLGILTPDQMADFTMTASASFERSPSDENVDALEDEVCEEFGAVGGKIERWDSQGSISGVEEEIIKRDISVIIRELRKKDNDNSSSSLSSSHTNQTEDFDSDKSQIPVEPEKLQIQNHKSLAEGANILLGKVHNSGKELNSFEKITSPQKLPQSRQSCERSPVCKSGKSENEADISEWQSGISNMTTSAASLDQGYQGDGEFDVPSEAGSATASSPTEDPHLFEGVIDIERISIDPNSSAATEADVSLADDETESETGVIPRDRTARIIDGKLYHSHRELVALRQGDSRHDAHTSEMDSSGFYSDLDPREEESARMEAPVLQPLKESKLDVDMNDSVLDDTPQDDEMEEYASVTITGHDHEKEIVSKDKNQGHEDLSLIEEDDKSSTCTIRSELKDISSSDNIMCVPSDSSISYNDKVSHSSETTSKDNITSSKISGRSKLDSDESTEISQTPTDSESCSIKPSLEDDSPVKTDEAAISIKPRNYEKPWLAKPVILKRLEKPKIILPPPPPMPKKNVQSKLKAMLEASEPSPEERRPRQPKKGRWDEVMSRIEEGKKEDKVRPKVKEVKSRLLDALKTPQPVSPQVERIRQERRERRERRERQAAANAVVRRMSERKRSIASNKPSRAPSLDSVGGIPLSTDSRSSTPDVSQHSTTSNEKKCQDLFVGTSRRAKIDNSKATLAKAFRGATGRAKQADPVKILRPTAPNGQTPSQIPSHISDQLKKLEAELCARTQEAQSAKEEVSRANRGLEALTVLVHYLTKEYNAFATPKLRAEVEQLRSQLTDVRLCLDESTAAARRLELEAEERCQKHEEMVKNLEEIHSTKIATIILEHQKKLGEVLEKHNEELREIINSEECKFESLIKSHNEELERIDEEWRAELDKQHKRHLHALEQLNSCHTQQLRDTEESWRHREQTLQENNARLLKEQDSLKQQAKKLEETLLSDKDHRLQAARRVCTALQNEVDSLKTVVDMRNSEVHKLRDQLADKERLSEELDCAKDRVRSLQAKTEDLHAQMETKLQLERQLLSDRHALSDSLQREASINKRLSLENEELQWKLRQRETNPHSTSTLDLVTRCSSSVARQQEGGKTGVLSPQFTPRSQRIGTKPHDKKWSQSITNIPEDAGKFLRRVELQQDVTTESPPPSPRVKAVIEKSNSVSFILDLNDTFPDEPFLTQSYHHSVKPRTPILQRKQLSKSFSHILEKSRSTSLVQGSLNGSLHRDPRDVSSQPSKDRMNGINKEKVNGDLTSANCENGSGKRPSKYRTHSTSESSDSGDIERISPTGLSWTVPVHSNLKRYSKHIPANRFQLVPEPPRLLQQPDEDEYEENENEFVEVLALGEDINSAPLTMLFGQTPSTSVSLSDSDVSQCGSRADLSSEDDDDDDGTLLQKESQSRPQEGAGEAMIFPDVFDLKKNGETCKNISKSQISSAPSSDSEDANQATNAEEPLNMSWSEDVECDLTSSSEMQEL